MELKEDKLVEEKGYTNHQGAIAQSAGALVVTDPVPPERTLSDGDVCESINKYSELWDLSPIGHLTVDRDGLTLQLHLAIPKLSGNDRQFPDNKTYPLFVSSEPHKLLYHLDKRGLRSTERRSSGLFFEKKWDAVTSLAHPHSITINDDGQIVICITLVDIAHQNEIKQRQREGLSEIATPQRGLENQDMFLRDETKPRAAEDIVGQSAGMQRALLQAEQVAATDSTVLIMGETGTGKEVLARAIHRMSNRKHRPLVTVNCASLPPTLIESELFGREKGAYTGAITKMAGRFEVADGSTLFLDEIGELPLELQSKLLRVLEDGVFERLGSTKPIRTNVRLIAATNKNLAEDVNAGRFRSDLYYRLNVFPIMIPPLRERPEDIPLLAWSFVDDFEKRMGKRIETISKKSMASMQSYSWPGNARELKNVIERAMITARGVNLDVSIPSVLSRDAIVEQNLHDVERRHILQVLERVHWKVTGKGSAAEFLGLKGSTLQSKMQKLSIKRPGS